MVEGNKNWNDFYTYSNRSRSTNSVNPRFFSNRSCFTVERCENTHVEKTIVPRRQTFTIDIVSKENSD
jgi:hypothetical protein